MRSINLLGREHVLISSALEALDELARRLEAREPVSGDTLRAVIDFVREYVDGWHHTKEELLFDAMAEVGYSRDFGQIPRIRREHEEGRDLMGDIEAALPGFLADRHAAADRIAAGAREFAELVREHIRIEDHIVFPIAQFRLRPVGEEALLARFAEQEQMLGEDVGKRGRQMVSELRSGLGLA